jgi:c-di-GMP-binding flagellar brake protein YcgR
MDCPQERRSYTRINLCAYSCGKSCTLEIDGKPTSATLVDISSGGARLRLPAPLADEPAGLVRLSVLGVQDKGLLQNLQGQVRWRNGQELGVKFETALDIGLSDLQRLVC